MQGSFSVRRSQLFEGVGGMWQIIWHAREKKKERKGSNSTVKNRKGERWTNGISTGHCEAQSNGSEKRRRGGSVQARSATGVSQLLPL